MNQSLIFLILVATVGCANFPVTKITPHFIDTERGYAREYKFKKVKPENCGDPDFAPYVTGVKKPISEMNGWMCIPVEQGQLILNHYVESLRRQKNCPSSQTPDIKEIYLESVELESLNELNEEY